MAGATSVASEDYPPPRRGGSETATGVPRAAEDGRDAHRANRAAQGDGRGRPLDSLRTSPHAPRKIPGARTVGRAIKP